ncbi:tyrosine-type recombinase/integrase [Necropsobacter massiliensis]|uniref:tyrosine-type recombinase/integrase n=1 Tax=Necropsobacter massiliensis TaxID=1400001 RepID=UPI000595A419|nr:integrase arm-type DNA-binding domain-containing protein [Necropsobacter massiliensis]
MPKVTTPLTDTEIKKSKPKSKEYILSDGGGLILRIKPNGAKLWIFSYYHPITKKRDKLGLGSYPELSLADVRAKREEYRQLLAKKIDPRTYEAQARQENADKQNRTFARMAEAWFKDRQMKADFTERTAKDTWALFERHILPAIGKYPIDQLTALIGINAFKPLERAGKLETVRKILNNVNHVMRYALHRGLIAVNNLAEIQREFDKPRVKGMNTIAPDELAEFLAKFYQARDDGRFSLLSFYAVMLALLTGSRPSEIARAQWEDIDTSAQTWSYRVQKGNKNLPEGRLHIVTLSRQAMAIFEKMREIQTALSLTGSPFVFASTAAKSGHITIEALRMAIIRSMGEGRLTTHGIRHLFSTSLNDKNYNADWIEKALSHKDKNAIRGTYNKAYYIHQRAEMLQAWADYVESLAPRPIVDK